MILFEILWTLWDTVGYRQASHQRLCVDHQRPKDSEADPPTWRRSFWISCTKPRGCWDEQMQNCYGYDEMFMFLYVFILSHCPGFLLFPKEGACGCWAKFHPLFGRSLFSARWSIWTRGAPRFGPASRTGWEHVEFSRQHDSSCWEFCCFIMILIPATRLVCLLRTFQHWNKSKSHLYIVH